MSRTEDIDNAIWDEADFYALSAPAKLIYIWSWTNRRCDFSGIYQVPLASIVSETKHDDQTVKDALVELEAASFVFYDGTWLWCKARVKRIRTGTVQMCKAIVKDLARVPEAHPYRGQLLELQGGRVWQSKEIRTTIREQLGYLTGATPVAPGTTGEGQGSHPANGSTAADSGSHASGTAEAPRTGTGTGSGKGTRRGRGAGKGSAVEKPYAPSELAQQMQAQSFPAETVERIDTAIHYIQSKRMAATTAMVRALLEDEAVAA